MRVRAIVIVPVTDGTSGNGYIAGVMLVLCCNARFLLSRSRIEEYLHGA